jgi:sugar phosphate isomerase/epimerase
MLPLDGEFKFKPFFERLETDGYEGACLIEVYRYAYANEAHLLESYNKVKKIHK